MPCGHVGAWCACSAGGRSRSSGARGARHSCDLALEDQEVEFEDVVKLAIVFSRPWSYLLIDAAEVYPAMIVAAATRLIPSMSVRQVP